MLLVPAISYPLISSFKSYLQFWRGTDKIASSKERNVKYGLRHVKFGGWGGGRKRNLNVGMYAVLLGGFTRRRQVIKMRRKEIRLSDAQWIHLAHLQYPVSASCEYNCQHSDSTNDGELPDLTGNYLFLRANSALYSNQSHLWRPLP